MSAARYFKIGLPVLAAVGAMWWLLEAGRHWKPLPNGGRVCVLSLTHGTQHHYRASAGSLLRGFGDSLRQLSLQPLKSSGAFYTYGTTSTRPAIHVFFGFDRADYSNLNNVQLVLPDGQSFPRSYLGDGRAVADMGFDVMPTRVRKFKITAETGGWGPGFKFQVHSKLEWEFENPAFLVNPPAWEAEPFPVRREAGPLRVTIRDVSVDRSSWSAKLDSSIEWHGAPAEDWFDVGLVLSDPSGNVSGKCGVLSEPVWKAEYHITESATFPFPEEDVQWIGTTAAASTAGTAEAFSAFPITPEIRAAGCNAAAMLSPGVYDVFTDGRVRLSPSSENGGRKGNPGFTVSMRDASGYFERLQVDEPSLLILGQSPKAVLHFKDSTNTPKRIAAPWVPYCGGSYPRIYSLPPSPLRFGLAKRAMRQLDFFIKSPQTASPTN
jgi:hypothetical protein